MPIRNRLRLWRRIGVATALTVGLVGGSVGIADAATTHSTSPAKARSTTRSAHTCPHMTGGTSTSGFVT